MSRVNMKDLLEAGAHFGHLTRRWNPKMKSYIYGERNSIHIVDLHQTLKGVETACDFVYDKVLNGGFVLFVGTKKQAQEATIHAATRAGQFYVAHRWLGGMLTNFQTIRESINKLKNLRELEKTGAMELRPKKEASALREQLTKLERVLGGIEDMPGMPSAIFIVDVREEHITLTEAKKLHIPVVAIVDTNCDPEDVDYVIPGNDDAIRAIKLVTQTLSDTVIDALQERDKQINEGAMRDTYIDQARRVREGLDPRLTGFSEEEDEDEEQGEEGDEETAEEASEAVAEEADDDGDDLDPEILDEDE